MKFYVYNHCGNITAFIKGSGVPIICYGEKVQELEPNIADAAVEKHVPVVQANGRKVTVTTGSTEHPILLKHYIEWIALATKQGNRRRELKPGQKPQAKLMVCPDDEVEAMYAYCNLHGLWKAQDFLPGDTGKRLD